MNKKIGTTALLIFVYTFISAQSNFVKSKLIDIKGDTLIGYIDYKNWSKSPTSIKFKANLTNESNSYDVGSLKGFIIDFNQEIYEAMSFTIENLSRVKGNINYLSMPKYATRKKDLSTKNCFVRRLSTGKVNLYQFVADDFEEHFLIKHDNKTEALVYHVIRIGDNVAHLRDYQNQLSIVLYDACKKLSINRTPYLLNDLQKLINSYNACFSETVVATPKERPNWEYGIGVGASYNKLMYTTVTQYGSTINYPSENKLTYTAEIFANYVFKRGRGRFAILNELNTYSLNNSYKNNYNDLFHHSLHYLALQNMLRYKFFIRQPNLYLLAGISNGFILSNKSTIERTNGDVIPTDRSFRNYEQAYIVGLGVAFKRIMLEPRFMRGNGFNTGGVTKTVTQRFQVLLKYNFGYK